MEDRQLGSFESGKLLPRIYCLFYPNLRRFVDLARTNPHGSRVPPLGTRNPSRLMSSSSFAIALAVSHWSLLLPPSYISLHLEFLQAQGIMPESSEATIPAPRPQSPLPQEKAKPKRRVSAAKAQRLLVTPSPTPSPKRQDLKLDQHMVNKTISSVSVYSHSPCYPHSRTG